MAGRNVPHLDGWRGCAIVLVLLGHFARPWVPGELGTLGVELFFVLSGRLMADILFVRKTPLPTFFYRRFSRIYPALLVYVVTSTVLFHGNPQGNGPLAAVLALTFTLNYAVYFGHAVPLLGHLWSVCVEEHAYSFLAIARVFLNSRRALLIGVGIVGVLSLINGAFEPGALGGGRPHYNFRTDASICMILLSAVGFLCIRGRQVPAWVAPTAIAVAAICWPIHSPWTKMATQLALVAAVNGLDSAPTFLRTFLSLRPLRQIGIWSFSIYLWQQPAFQFTVVGTPNYWMIPAMLVAGVTSFYLIEQPARRFLNQRDPFHHGRWDAQPARARLAESLAGEARS